MKIITYLLIGIIKIYKIFISPLFLIAVVLNQHVVQYCIDSLKTYGLIVGLTKSILELHKCNPWFGYGGYDPVKKEKKTK